MRKNTIPFVMTGEHSKSTVVHHLRNFLLMLENSTIEHVSGGVNLHREVVDDESSFITLSTDLKVKVSGTKGASK